MTTMKIVWHNVIVDHIRTTKFDYNGIVHVKVLNFIAFKEKEEGGISNKGSISMIDQH